MPTFYMWLSQQTERRDAVGVFARFAVRDRVFPRDNSRLHICLSRYEGMPEQRNGVKLAHREWRRTRRERKTS